MARWKSNPDAEFASFRSQRSAPAGLGDVPVVGPHLAESPPPEHDVELGESKHEGVALVDERDPNLIGEFLGEPGRQLEAAEAGAQDHHLSWHGQTLVWRVWRCADPRRLAAALRSPIPVEDRPDHGQRDAKSSSCGASSGQRSKRAPVPFRAASLR